MNSLVLFECVCMILKPLEPNAHSFIHKADHEIRVLKIRKWRERPTKLEW